MLPFKGVVPVLQVKEAENIIFGDVFERLVLRSRRTKLVQIFVPVNFRVCTFMIRGSKCIFCYLALRYLLCYKYCKILPKRTIIATELKADTRNLLLITPACRHIFGKSIANCVADRRTKLLPWTKIQQCAK